MDIILAIILGSLFGFVLQRVGATNPQVIINMLRLNDLHLMRTILLAVAIASALLFTGLSMGALDPSHLSVKTTFTGVIIGGVIFGIGWALAGYCPGTGLAALGDGRKDAGFFILGGLFGAFIYTAVHSQLIGTVLLNKFLGGKVTLAVTPDTSYHAIIESVPGAATAFAVALAFGFIAWRLPAKSS
jgi:uncharacterized membrane protein YedE/YeeE